MIRLRAPLLLAIYTVVTFLWRADSSSHSPTVWWTGPKIWAGMKPATD